MRPSTWWLLGSTLWMAGWVLVMVFDDNGASTGVAEALWRVGGLMVYASVVVVLWAASLSLALGIAAARRCRQAR